MHRTRPPATIALWALVVTVLMTAQAFAQTASPARVIDVIDLTGEWAARVHEDAIWREAALMGSPS